MLPRTKQKNTQRMLSNMKTLKDFAVACVDLDGEQIYELYENHVPAALLEEINKLADTFSPEPTRSALIKIGYMFGVQNLIEY